MSTSIAGWLVIAASALAIGLHLSQRRRMPLGAWVALSTTMYWGLLFVSADALGERWHSTLANIGVGMGLFSLLTAGLEVRRMVRQKHK